MARTPALRMALIAAAAASAGVLSVPVHANATPRYPAASLRTIAGAAQAAQRRFGVPASLLKAICYLEGHLSDHGGAPSSENGYGCMDLARNSHLDTLDQAARLLGVPASSVRRSQWLNIAGAAAVLRADAISLSGRVPATLGGWYGAIAEYSGAQHDIAAMYASEVYRILRDGLTATAPTGEVVRIAPTAVRPDMATARTVAAMAPALPAHCTANPGVDYPSAYNCIVPTGYAGVTYDTGSRPRGTLPILGVTVHDTEENLDSTIATFWKKSNAVSIHYVVDTDGTVYQCLHEKDVAFQNGNFWYNQRTIGIEHVGVDATGYQWYNATQYLGSAKLVAYLLTKYGIPLDHDHVMSHGTTPAPTLGTSPNHVDPGPYWLWDYYLGLINQQGVPFATGPAPAGVIRFDPPSGQQPGGAGGAETASNFNFFTLYTQPSTASATLPSVAPLDITQESNNVEATVSYDVLAQQPDAAGTGDTMYEIWYGATLSPPRWSTTGTTAWIAAPPGSAEQGYGTVVTLSGKNGKSASVYGKPGGTSGNVTGSTPAGSAYLSPWTVTVSSGILWYAINYNHRQAWIPASEVTSTRTT